MSRASLVAATVFVLITSGSPAVAQQRPLVTEDPETIGAGQILIEAGLDWKNGQPYPVSGLTGDLLRVPVAGVSIGLSSIAELQLDGSLYDRLSVSERKPAPLSGLLEFTGDSTSDVGDFTIATKLRLLRETPGRPGISARFATQLPIAGNESGLGLDTTNFFATLIVGKTVQSVRIVGNVGLGILGDPIRGDAQNDVLTYATSVARAFTDRAELVAEVNGHLDIAGEPPPGTESRGTIRLGGRYTTGPGRVDGAVLIGLTSRDADFGFTFGYTHVFNAFRIP